MHATCPAHEPAQKRRSRSVTIYVLFVFLLLLFAFFLSDPATYAKSVSKGIGLWAVNVLPATFPFLFLTALLTSLPPFHALAGKLSPYAGRLFRVSGAGGGVALLSAFSGYPVGARLIGDLHSSGRISQSEVFRLACLATTSGPPFLVGTVGAVMFQSAKAGWILLASHLLSIYTVCFLLRFSGSRLPPSRLPPPDKVDLFEAVSRSVLSVLCVGGFIALFYCFGDMLGALGLLRGGILKEGVIRGLLEMTAGCAVLSRSPSPLTLSLSCALVTFGGACVLCQELAFLSRASVKAAPFVCVKFLQAVLSFGICYLFSSLCLF